MPPDNEEGRRQGQAQFVGYEIGDQAEQVAEMRAVRGQLVDQVKRLVEQERHQRDAEHGAGWRAKHPQDIAVEDRRAPPGLVRARRGKRHGSHRR